MKNNLTYFISTLILILLTLPSASFAKIEVKKHVLDNGLTILLFEEHQSPVIACRLFYTTGSVHEAPGFTGIAHMLEHMLFKGTKKVGITDSLADQAFIRKIDSIIAIQKKLDPEKDSLGVSRIHNTYDSLLTEQRKLFVKDELWSTYLKAGGSGLNAFTSDLMTAYFVTLPKNKMELFLWLESDRMQNAILREFYPERDVVMEERRMRYEDSPLGRYWETLIGMFYEAHPYRQPTIGYASDIKHYTREMAEEHYRKFYSPNNAILVLAGDFTPEPALQQIKKYFGTISKGEKQIEVVTREPEQVGAKNLTVHKNEAQPRLDIMFHTPGVPHKDIYALEIVEGVLSGKSGRLYRELVTRQKLALSASAGNQPDKYHSMFHISAGLGADPNADSVETLIWKELDSLKSTPISSRELQRVKNQVTARTLRELRSMEHLATRLAFFELWNSWELINIYPEEVDKITAKQVQEVCNRYFLKKKSTTGLVLPETVTSLKKKTEK
ncbi:MAG: insulinase family protein [Fibrobacteria bacterium]|nr:insulinase family protein [Fibrobacteria bacterium]